MQAVLPGGSTPALLGVLEKGSSSSSSSSRSNSSGNGLKDISISIAGLNASIVVASAVSASQRAYAHAYHLAWANIVPFVVLARYRGRGVSEGRGAFDHGEGGGFG